MMRQNDDDDGDVIDDSNKDEDNNINMADIESNNFSTTDNDSSHGDM
jgi:hypothetical protein